METRGETDLDVGTGTLFSVLAVAMAVATAILSYWNALSHDGGHTGLPLQLWAGIAFAGAMLAAAMAVVGLHLYGD